MTQEGAKSAMAVVLHADNISKQFPGVKALDSVSIKVHSGEVLGLLGENGAGKSTLLNVLSGIYKPDKGQIVIDGKPTEINGPRHARELGIAIVHQELKLMHNLSVAENIYMGRLPRTALGRISYRQLFNNAKHLLDKFGFTLDPKSELRYLSIASRQLVEIAKALSTDAKVILMDEPTSSLTAEETEHLFEVIDTLKRNNVGIVFISHKLEEIFRCCNRVQVLRDGQDMGVRLVQETSNDELVRTMVGREVSQRFPVKESTPGEMLLEVRGLSRGESVQNVSFSVRAGEVFGIAGLVGSGRSELVRLIYGADRKTSGDVFIRGRKVDIESPQQAIKNGVFLVPEDRKLQGLIVNQTIEMNISLAVLRRIQKVLGFIDGTQEREMADREIQKLDIKCTGRGQEIVTLSGGNQQKVVLGKSLETAPDIMILDDPTRGIDVKTKAEIYELISKLTQNQKAVILISSELVEVIGMSDRVGVMHEGKMQVILDRRELSQENVIKYAIGGGRE
jgi:ribose transport system ATP-binding protein